ncbi:Tetratricopeptide-like helical [Penicillium fimorum]|uniref:Tetratricopeptide-like helical n=1 Tax=Penicillium fimorum TaxID=1882269 RepID=A0A9X0CBP9_9EURO|nr:Tetratricopeptide-like helical [Penicillium fimorum]
MASKSFSGINHGLQIGVNNGLVNNLPLATGNSNQPVIDRPIRTRLRFCQPRRTALSDSRGWLSPRIEDSTCWPRRCWLEGNRSLLSNTPTESDPNLPQHGVSGCMRVTKPGQIPGRQDPQVNLFKLVENWLRDEKTGKWLCILDNVDDDQLLRSVPAADNGDSMRTLANVSKKPPLEYIPRSQHGSVIITSQSREVALKMVDHKGIVDVKPMERSESLELLQRKLNRSSESQGTESQECQQLVNALEFMPLANHRTGR